VAPLRSKASRYTLRAIWLAFLSFFVIQFAKLVDQLYAKLYKLLALFLHRLGELYANSQGFQVGDHEPCQLRSFTSKANQTCRWKTQRRKASTILFWVQTSSQISKPERIRKNGSFHPLTTLDKSRWPPCRHQRRRWRRQKSWTWTKLPWPHTWMALIPSQILTVRIHRARRYLAFFIYHIRHII